MRDYTIAAYGVDPRYDDFRELFNAWFIAYLDLTNPRKIDEFVPPASEIGRALPDHVEAKNRTVDGTPITIPQRSHAHFPTRTHLPEVPFIDINDTEESQ